MVFAFNKTIALLALLVFTGALATTIGRKAVYVAAPVRDAVSGRTVAIDAGHGGPDSGARGKSGVIEKHVNLHIALELQKLLGRASVHTVMTRTTDADLLGDGEDITGSRKRAELQRRAVIVNGARPDIFVTIHSNSFPEPQWWGAQVFYDPQSEAGRRLAVHIQTQLVQNLGPNRRKARPADIYLLRAVDVPSALVEVGFLSNPGEERLLSDPSYRVRVAEAIYAGMVSYFMDSGEKQAGQDWGVVKRVSTSSAAPDMVLLYFGGPTNLDDCLMPEARPIDGLSSMNRLNALQTVVEALVSGPGKESILQPTIPGGVVIRWVRLEGDTAVVNFSREFVSNHWGGSTAEEMTVYSIVNTLTELAFVRGVRIMVEGEAIRTITGHLDIGGTLRRDTSMVHFRN